MHCRNVQQIQALTEMTEATQTIATFSRDIDISWYRSPIDKELLAQLMQRNDLRGWVQTICHLGFFFITAALAYLAFLNIDEGTWYWSVPFLLVALFIHGTMGPFMGLIAVHELQHRTVFKAKALNAFFEKLYAFISWSDYLWYRASHVKHHQATCHEAYDGEVQLPIKFSLKQWSFWLGLLAWNPLATWQRLKLVWRHANGHIKGEWYNHVLPKSNPGLRRKHRNWARTLLIGHSLLALCFIDTGHGFLIVVFTFGTLYCGWLGFLCGVTQHFGLSSNVPDFRLNTRTFTCSWLPAFYYWNMQYHLEHHMFPGVPFYNLPKLRKAIEHDLPPVTHGLLSTWRELLSQRQKLRADPHYRIVPELPVRDAVAEHR
jgi:fatty acid desaturase|tara:strand:- start:2403 stop:3524 length:1122 start_codon:yes stop_codon:yes gene_type:complete